MLSTRHQLRQLCFYVIDFSKFVNSCGNSDVRSETEQQHICDMQNRARIIFYYMYTCIYNIHI